MITIPYLSFWFILFTWAAGLLITLWLKKQQQLQPVPVLIEKSIRGKNDVF